MSSSSNPLWFVSKRYKKKGKATPNEKLPELGDDIADDDELISYRPGLNVDPDASNNYRQSVTSNHSKTSTLTKMSTTSSTGVNKDKCTCCQHPLIRKDKVGLVTFTFPKCKDCESKICRNCIVKNRCHECIIKEKLKNKLIPDILMKLDRDELLGYIEQLHYPMDHFKSCETKYLVKQILVRFGVGNDWDPRFHNETLDSSSDGRFHGRPSITTESDISHNPQVKHRPPKDPSIDSSMDAVIDAEFERRLQEKEIIHNNQRSPYLADARLRTSYGTSGYNSLRIAGPMQAAITKGLEQSVEEKNRRQEAWASSHDSSFNLLDVKTPAYFENLSKVELIAILNKHSVPSDSFNEKHELKFAVLRLWNDLKAQAPPRPVQHQHQPQKRMTDEVRTLHDIPSINAIEDLSTAQMIQLMTNHGINVKADIKRQELVYELKRMWPEAKQSLHQQQIQVHKQERTPSLGDILSASDIENLTANQLRGMLSNNGIDPRQYPEVHEMRYMIRQLWYRTQQRDRSGYRSNDHNRSMESPYSIDDRYRASMRRNNLQKGKSMNELDNLTEPKAPAHFNPFAKPGKPSSSKRYQDDSVDTTSDSGYQHLRPMYTKQMSMPVLAISLTDIRQPEDIQDLSVGQLKSILSSNRVEMSRLTDKAEMAWKVKELWMDKKAQESENLRRQKGYPDPYYNTSAFTPVNDMPPPPPLSPSHYDQMLPKEFPTHQPATIQRTISLENIKRPEEIVTLSRIQMRSLLERYKVHVPDPNDKANLMELTRRLWLKKNGEDGAVVKYVDLDHQGSPRQHQVPMRQKDVVYAKITPSAFRKSFRSEEQLRRMDDLHVAPLEPESARNPVKLVEVRSGETATIQRHNRSSGIWREEEFRTSSPITTQSHSPLTSVAIVNELASIQSLDDIRTIDVIPRLTIKQMKYILSKHAVDFAGCSEKKEFEIHLSYLWKTSRGKLNK